MSEKFFEGNAHSQQISACVHEFTALTISGDKVDHPSITNEMIEMNGALGHDSALVRRHWAGDNLG